MGVVQKLRLGEVFQNSVNNRKFDGLTSTPLRNSDHTCIRSRAAAFLEVKAHTL